MLDKFVGQGIQKTASRILKWPEEFDKKQLLQCLFSLFVMIEIGGTGGGSFRYMYSRFLKEVYQSIGEKAILEASNEIEQSGRLFTQIAQLFETVFTAENIYERIVKASDLFKKIAEVENKAFSTLSNLF